MNIMIFQTCKIKINPIELMQEVPLMHHKHVQLGDTGVDKDGVMEVLLGP